MMNCSVCWPCGHVSNAVLVTSAITVISASISLRIITGDSHWMMVYGNHVREFAYATRKLGIQWADLS